MLIIEMTSRETRSPTMKILALFLSAATGAFARSPTECQTQFKSSISEAFSDLARCSAVSVYDDCLASSDPAADDAFYAEADSARAQGNCPDNAAGLPRIVTKDEGNLVLEVDSNKDVYITRLRREAVSVVDLDKRVGEVELAVAAQTDANAAQFTTAFGVASDTLAKTFTANIGTLNEGIAEVASTKKDIDSKQSEFEDSINGALQSALADAAEKAAADNVALKGAVEQVKVEVSKEIDDVKKTADASGECAGSGLAWNGDKCVAQNIVVAVNAGLKCNGDNVGRVRFDKESKSMQLCNGEEWGSVGSSSAKPCVDKEYGSVECNPATSCQTLGLLGRVPAAGKVFYIGTLSYSSKWKCQRDKMWQVGDVDKTYGGVSFGDGSDGDFSCDKKGTIFINEVFPSYNPREHRIPQWKNVVIKDGCTLSVADFDGSGNSGGVLAFRASGKVTIQKGGQISVDRLGNRGGLAPGWKPSSELNHFYAPQGYSSNTESGRGVGDGGGYGGRGGGGWHGSGGGGGSFARKGGKGSPDKCRNNRGNHQFGYDHDNSWAPPGPEYMYKSNFFHPFEVMGSGGGAGGAGHPTQSESPAQNGGAGGGTMQIMAKDWANAGKLYARGEAGLPYKRFHYWPDKNAQVGSGGAGSGGFIKIMTGSAGGTGPYDIAGGAQPLVTNWCQRDHQRGGSGGNGRISHVKALKDA